MPLLSGVMGAGAEEKPPRGAVDVFWAAGGGTYFCDSFQTQLGLQVKQLTAQLQQNTRKTRSGDSRSCSCVFQRKIYLHKFPLETADGWMLPGARRQHHPLSEGVKAQTPLRTPTNFGFGVQLTMLPRTRGRTLAAG